MPRRWFQSPGPSPLRNVHYPEPEPQGCTVEKLWTHTMADIQTRIETTRQAAELALMMEHEDITFEPTEQILYTDEFWCSKIFAVVARHSHEGDPDHVDHDADVSRILIEREQLSAEKRMRKGSKRGKAFDPRRTPPKRNRPRARVDVAFESNEASWWSQMDASLEEEMASDTNVLTPPPAPRPRPLQLLRYRDARKWPNENRSWQELFEYNDAAAIFQQWASGWTIRHVHTNLIEERGFKTFDISSDYTLLELLQFFLQANGIWNDQRAAKTMNRADPEWMQKYCITELVTEFAGIKNGRWPRPKWVPAQTQIRTRLQGQAQTRTSQVQEELMSELEEAMTGNGDDDDEEEEEEMDEGRNRQQPENPEGCTNDTRMRDPPS